jgi:hypothetical protein
MGAESLQQSGMLQINLNFLAPSVEKQNDYNEFSALLTLYIFFYIIHLNVKIRVFKLQIEV